MPELTKADILGRDDLKREKVDVPEWGAHDYVYVQTMPAIQRDAWEASCAALKKDDDADDMGHMVNFRARLAVLVICDSNGKATFDVDDADALGLKSCAALDRIFAVAKRLNGLTDEDVKELEKNSETDQGAASSSDLPSASE